MMKATHQSSKIYVLRAQKSSPSYSIGQERELCGIYRHFSENKRDIVWVEADELLAVEPQSTSIYLLSDFHGPVFEHLKKHAACVYGIMYLKQCIETKTSPTPTRVPLYSGSLNGVIVSFTGLSAELRQELGQLVQYMQGKVSGQLDRTVTHLVAKNCNTTSEKYKAAPRLKLPVMRIDWIRDAWMAAISFKEINMTGADVIEEYKLPIFTDCPMSRIGGNFQTISVTGFSAEERTPIGRLIEMHGGAFSGEMLRSGERRCTHLIAKSNSGEKFQRATEWGTVHIVDVKWLNKCVEEGYRLSEEKYRRKSGEHLAAEAAAAAAMAASMSIDTENAKPGSTNQKEEEMAKTLNNYRKE